MLKPEEQEFLRLDFNYRMAVFGVCQSIIDKVVNEKYRLKNQCIILNSSKQRNEVFKMYVTSYKTNNSYTTYVIHNSGEDRSDNYYYRKPMPTLEWKQGAKVSHSFYGLGTISEITNHLVKVHFKNAKMIKKFRNIQVAFEYSMKPCEIDSLRLCY